MRSCWKIAVCSFLSLLVLLLAGPPAHAQGIVGSYHDFSSSGWNWVFMQGDDDEICLPCHTPHNADGSVIQAPLWNHEVTTATFALYSSGTLNAVPGQPDGVSKLCLSCHDGTVALDSWGGQTGTVFWGAGHNDVMGTDLTDDHPISLAYDAALAGDDGDLLDPATTASGLGGTIDADLLFNGSLECASCHDAHDELGIDKMLRLSNANSALCLTCHDK